MASIADDLRRRTAAQVRRMTVSERIDLAFALGEDDLALYLRTHDADRASAVARLRAARQVGRRPSRSAGGFPR